jgi:hypothetical protein
MVGVFSSSGVTLYILKAQHLDLSMGVHHAGLTVVQAVIGLTEQDSHLIFTHLFNLLFIVVHDLLLFVALWPVMASLFREKDATTEP